MGEKKEKNLRFQVKFITQKNGAAKQLAKSRKEQQNQLE